MGRITSSASYAWFKQHKAEVQGFRDYSDVTRTGTSNSWHQNLKSPQLFPYQYTNEATCFSSKLPLQTSIAIQVLKGVSNMVMALKTVWIVPRWSGRLERGGYVKGHDPEVSKAPTRRSCCHDMTSYLYMSLWLGQRSHGKAERSSYSGFKLTVSTLGTVDMSSKVDGLWTKSLKQGKKSNNHKF